MRFNELYGGSMELRDSVTFTNLQEAYKSTLATNGKYDLFSKKADQDTLIEIHQIFDTASRNELFISERLRRIIFDGTPNTLQNLIEAREDAAFESNLYREYARKAQEEGFGDISSLFNGIANIRLNHESIFQSLIIEIQTNELFCKKEESLWVCLGCGNILSGPCAPDICPICGYPQGYYQFLRPV